MSAQQTDKPNQPGSPRLSLLQRLTFLFRSYEIPADCLQLRGPFKRDDRHCHTIPLPPEWVSDASGRSAITLFEDGLPLGPAHVSHDDIRTLGKGRYSHWGEALYFSTSDDTDPNTNGRVYSVQPPVGWHGTLPCSPWPAPLPHVAPDVAPDMAPGSAPGTTPGTAPNITPEVAPGGAADKTAAGATVAGHPSATHAAPTHAAGNGARAADRTDTRADTRSGSAAARARHEPANLPSLGWRIRELTPASLAAFDGLAVRCELPADWPSDADNVSTVLLLEDDVPLAHPHALHADIAARGGGRYSHWGTTLIFSSSDGSDPATNGRRYAAAWADALLFSHAPHPPRREAGHCHVLPTLPRHWVSDDSGSSRLMLLEDGRPLGPAHAPHTEIRELGRGRLSHWRGQLWFSTSDNSDPATNGRTYAVLPLD